MAERAKVKGGSENIILCDVFILFDHETDRNLYDYFILTFSNDMISHETSRNT